MSGHSNPPTSNVPSPPGEQGARAATMGITHFNFEHRVFKAPGARFLMKGHARIPTFRVDMGDLEGLIEIDVLKKEFNITPGSHDNNLVDMAVAGLRYVPDIKPGDTIPSELLNGQASWAVSPKHKQIAEQRLQVQLLSWVSGKELLLTDPKEIAIFLEQIENREKLRAAFRDAAKALGYEPENTEPVIRQLELLARELCYIEALRDRFSLIPKIAEKMTILGKSYGNDRGAKMELVRVQGLLNLGIQEYTTMFGEADAQTGEIISAMKTLDRQVKYIRQTRDDLHFLMMQWDPHVNDLDKWHTRRAPETDKVLSNLYRYLAPRFSSGRSLMKRRVDGHAAQDDKEKDSKKPVQKAPAQGAKPQPKKAVS